MAIARALLISLAAPLFLISALPAFANIPRASLLIENSHPGLADVATIPHQADAPANPLIAPGLPACLCDEGRRTSVTGKERDNETGLDYFGARYMSSAQGRFTSADEPFADQDESDPQSWNLYTYVRNNPLRYNDPTGRCSQSASGYTDDGEGLFPGACSGGTIGDSKSNKNSVTVGVGGDEARLIMLGGIGERLSSPHQWATVVSGAGQSAGALMAPLPTAIAQCAGAGALGGGCSKTNIAIAAVPFGPGRLARILRRHSFASVIAKNVSKFAKGLDDEAHVEALIESALASPRRATGYADGAAFIDANLGVTIGTDAAGKSTTTIRVVLDNAGNVHSAFPIPQIH